MTPEPSEATGLNTQYERRAVKVDRWITIAIVLVLLIPFPFARFEGRPTGAVISEHMIMPWSSFKLCYIAFPNGEPTEERYEFTWKGQILPREASSSILFPINSEQPAILKWQSLPDISLKGIFLQGDMIQLRTFWQPILLWPFKMVLRAGSQLSDYPGKQVQPFHQQPPQPSVPVPTQEQSGSLAPS